MTNQQTIFVVDDDPAARESVAALIKSKGWPVETFSSAEDFLEAYDRSRRGCLVADVRMNGMSGLELQERLVAEEVCLPVIIITGYASVPIAVKAMKGGAMTLLEKPCADQELWNHISQALDWENQRRGLQNVRDQIERRLAELSTDEMAVLKLLVAGNANKAIASELDIGLRTVELRRSRVMKKMGVDSLAELVRLTTLVLPADTPAL